MKPAPYPGMPCATPHPSPGSREVALPQPPPSLLLLDLEGLPADWALVHGQALPFLRGLLEQGVWLGWASPGPTDGGLAWRGLYDGQPSPAGQGLLWRELSRAGVPVGIMNLPGVWPPPAVPGWLVARLDEAGQARHFTTPAELAGDLGEYQSGQLALAGRPAPRPHQRDEVFALWACLARLVWQEAWRLMRASPPRLAGLGFQGLGQVYNMFAADPGRVSLLLAQMDEYAGRLAGWLKPRAILCLAGRAGLLVWAPGLIQASRLPEPRPWDLTPLVLGLLGLDIPPEMAGRPPAGLWPQEPHD